MNVPDLDYRGLFDASPNPYLVLDRSLNIVGANKAYLAATKRELADIVGRWAWDAFPTDPKTLEQSVASFERVIRTRQPDTMALLRFDIPRPESDGGGFEKRYWTIIHTPVLNQAGEVEVVLQHPIDVTELERLRDAVHMLENDSPLNLTPAQSEIFNRAQSVHEANVALKADRDRLHALFAQAPSPIVVLTGKTLVFELANEAYYQFVGRRDIIGKPLLEAFPEVAGQGFDTLLDEVFETGKPHVGHGLKVTLQRKPGEPLKELYHDVLYQPLLGPDGKVSAIFCQVNEVTEAYQAQSALRESQERLQEGMAAARMVVWNWEFPSGRISLSENASDILGGSWDTAESIFRSVHPDDVERLRNTHLQATLEHPRYRAEYRFIRPDSGQIIWLENRCQVLFDASEAQCHVKGVTLDITERKRSEEELRKADLQKDEFLAMLGHELRNPLAPIRAAAELMAFVRLDEEKLRATSDVISRQVDHMTALVDDLLDVSRVTRGLVTLEKNIIDLKHVVSDAVEQAGPLIESRHHQLTIHLTSDPARMVGDEKRLVQIVSNVLNNAAKYTPDGGRIALRMEIVDDNVEVSVTDNGIGISDELRPYVFDLFKQASRTPDRTQGGLGLGLALVKSLMELHGGNVAVESKGAGAGSKFTLTFPRLVTEASRFSQQQANIPAHHAARTLRILVVDDNQDAAQMLAMFLETAGYEVLVTHSARDAIAEAGREQFDVYVLDIGLPDMDGNELTRRLRNDHKDTRATFIAVTGYGQKSDQQACFEAGFHYHLVKPVDAKRLLATLSGIESHHH